MAVTIVMSDLGNSLQFEVKVNDGTHIYILNKINIQIKQDGGYIYLTDAGGFQDTINNKVVRASYKDVGNTIGGTPIYSDNDALLTAIIGSVSSVSLGGGGGGGGNNTYTNVNNTDFSASAGIGTKQITIGGLGAFTLEDKNVIAGSIDRIDSTGDVKSLSLTNVVVSGGVITLGDIDDFATGDTVLMTLLGPDKGYDTGIDSIIASILNQDSEKWTSEEHLVDAAEDATTLYYVIPMEGFKDLSKHWKFTGGGVVTMTLWGTNNPAADDTAITDWVDITGDYLTKTLTVSAGTIEFAEVLENLFFKKVMIRLVTTGTTNVMDIYIKKKAL